MPAGFLTLSVQPDAPPPRKRQRYDLDPKPLVQSTDMPFPLSQVVQPGPSSQPTAPAISSVADVSLPAPMVICAPKLIQWESLPVTDGDDGFAWDFEQSHQIITDRV